MERRERGEGTACVVMAANCFMCKFASTYITNLFAVCCMMAACAIKTIPSLRDVVTADNVDDDEDKVDDDETVEGVDWCVDAEDEQDEEEEEEKLDKEETE